MSVLGRQVTRPIITTSIGGILAVLVVSVTALSGHWSWNVPPQITNPIDTNHVAPAQVTTQPISKSQLLTLVNAERAKVGAPVLQEDSRLDGSAQAKADLMVMSGYGHIGPDGRHGYELAHEAVPACVTVSENIDAAKTATETVQEWHDSPTHYQAMVDPKYSLTGFGVATYGDYFYITQHLCGLH